MLLHGQIDAEHRLEMLVHLLFYALDLPHLLKLPRSLPRPLSLPFQQKIHTQFALLTCELMSVCLMPWPRHFLLLISVIALRAACVYTRKNIFISTWRSVTPPPHLPSPLHSHPLPLRPRETNARCKVCYVIFFLRTFNIRSLSIAQVLALYWPVAFFFVNTLP